MLDRLASYCTRVEGHLESLRASVEGSAMVTTPTLSQLLTECHELDAKAAPGPWPTKLTELARYLVPEDKWNYMVVDSNAAFIAHARTLLPLLVEECERLQSYVDDLLRDRQAEVDAAHRIRAENRKLVERLEASWAAAKGGK